MKWNPKSVDFGLCAGFALSSCLKSGSPQPQSDFSPLRGVARCVKVADRFSRSSETPRTAVSVIHNSRAPLLSTNRRGAKIINRNIGAANFLPSGSFSKSVTSPHFAILPNGTIEAVRGRRARRIRLAARTPGWSVGSVMPRASANADKK